MSIALAAIAFYPLAAEGASTITQSPLESIGSVGELWSLAVYALQTLSSHYVEWYATLLGATIFAALCWWAASAYSRLWNLRFRITLRHHVLCFLAAALTWVFAVLFVSLRYTREAAEVSINLWRAELLADSQWQSGTFATTYEAVRKLGIEDFSNYPPPETGGNRIPLTKPDSVSLAASIYANSAAMNFRQRRPFLSKVLSVRPEISKGRIKDAVNEFFAHGGTIYHLEDAVDIAGAEIKSALQGQTGRIVPLTRTCLVLLFIVVQFIPFGLIGLAAYKDLRVTT